ncbi:hypothetical protein [Clostridium aciditolerans]|uniref:IDEAL domain-containing protein n=1 Tax=Clostridium aciditolerans TaxID=339861 RepID=A0A934M5W8_9CLOT|nr:hypothetical protein [Clostridium aciditolerans]MBI6875520.1 hypothetical protein [Clostridium aciditolerans]
MEINNFILPNYSKDDNFEYGIKIVPKRIPDRLTDSIIVSIEKNIKGKNRYNLCFKRKRDLEVINNSYSLSKEVFREYISFLVEFANELNGENKNNKEFNIKNQGKIIISSLNKEYIKISSIRVNNNSSVRVFFTLLEKELLTYINVLKDIYLEKCINNYLIYQMNYLVNPLTKEERKNLYIGALYAFADSALDNRDKNRFDMLSKEIRKILGS